MYRSGGNEKIHVDVRVISATNKNIPEEIKKATFREDLYYRLNTFSVQVPTLCDRKEDILYLIKYFLQTKRKQNKAPKFMSKEAMIWLSNFSYSGNIRQLSNVIERLLMLSDGNVILLEDAKQALEGEISRDKIHSPLEKVNRETVLETLAKHGFNKRLAAQELNVGRNTLYRYIDKFGLHEPAARA